MHQNFDCLPRVFIYSVLIYKFCNNYKVLCNYKFGFKCKTFFLLHKVDFKIQTKSVNCIIICQVLLRDYLTHTLNRFVLKQKKNESVQTQNLEICISIFVRVQSCRRRFLRLSTSKRLPIMTFHFA